VITELQDRRRVGPAEVVGFALLAIAASLVMAWWKPWQVTLNDYAGEAAGPLLALLHGRILTFLSTAPTYGPSLELRAPFALIASLANGSALLIYRFAALPCLLATAGLGVWIAVELRRAGRGILTALLTIGVCVANPLTYYALEIGHPEELLGGVLCVLAVVLAYRGRALLAGVVLGLAIANKEWALIAIAPVLLALPAGRIRALITAGAVSALMLGPIALASASAKAASGRITADDTGAIFYTEQIWWFLGRRGPWVASMAGQIMPGYRLPPTWLEGRAHMLIVWIGLPLGWLAARRRMRREDALALLALLALLRCMLDPWDLVYYPLPFILALLSWETLVRRRPPFGALAATLAAWAIFEYLPLHVSANQQGLTFLIASVCATAALCWVIYRPRSEQPQSTTRSSFVNWLRRLAPSSLSTTRSSIRTPSSPGR
jgi:hypothetical protein